ncbi:VOC family protein [Mesorhizobium sp.]|uniref:VOC family protein n=1 Tax=Mesorhizobium sp. TaxID=1871066 RepID=UPI00122AF905|nr:VOC family protein [Mesorhizobium sp.]TIO74196.1 MAG: glyoxalase/bleomycin resistance/extradiol dioxygenase family protein [Mesorhizobium sp.]
MLESALYVTDLQAAEQFYRDIIGLEALGKVEGRHVFFRCGDGVLLLFNAEATKIPPAPDAKVKVPPHGTAGEGHLCFTATAGEIVEWRRHLAAKNIAIESDFEWPQGGHSIYIRDPSGNSIEFAEPRIWGL